MLEDSEEIIACDREIGLKDSFYDFIKMAWSQVYADSPFQDNWHIPLMAEHYEAVFRGEIDELVVNIPPNSSKSCITCVLFPAWLWIRDPALALIMATYAELIFRRDSNKTVDLMRSKWYQARWGDRFSLPTVAAVDYVVNDKGGFRLGTTPGGKATGLHANIQILDDPNKPEDASAVGLQNIRDWYARTMSTRWRKPPQKTGLICIMQRLHCSDLAQMFLDRGATHLMLPANFDPKRRCRTPYGYDPRTQEGELLDPHRLPQNLIDKLRRNLGSMNAAAQLDQQPVPEGGAIFQREWLKFYSEAPKAFDQVILSWDLAYKDGESSDYACGQVWGRKGADFYLLDQAWDRMSFSTALDRIRDQAKRWPQATAKLIEEKANGAAVLQVLQSKLSGLVAVDPRGGKFSRASACSGLFQAGNVHLPDPDKHPWVAGYITELLTFPRSAYDDRVDATTQALLYLQQNESWLAPAMVQVRKWLAHEV
jgi:predicted phage terminase large subunit-like protein